jgi:CheY-like chemotaxis protein
VPVRLLLVEDTDDLRRLFSRVLKANGFDVLEASDGHEALELLEGFRPELVVTDLMMPGMDGFELIRRVRAIPGLADLPIVAITAAATAEAECEARRAGAADILPKPLDSRDLLRRLEEFRH